VSCAAVSRPVRWEDGGSVVELVCFEGLWHSAVMFKRCRRHIPHQTVAKPPSPTRQPEPFDSDEVYRQLGIFVVSFQYVESRLAEICWLLTEPPYADGERQVLAQLPYGRLVQETRDRFAAFLERRQLDRPEFVERSQRVLDECRDLGHLRNRIVHSAYVHLEAGGELQGIMRSNLRHHGANDDPEDDIEFLSLESFKDTLTGLAHTAFTLGQLQTQLIHWSP
jgi:hypothetical protein